MKHKTPTLKLLVIAVAAVAFVAGCQSQPAPVTPGRAALAPPAPGNPTANPLDPATAKHFEGTWKNEMGSVMTITSVDAQTGSVTGTYRTATGAGNVEFPLAGWVNVVSASPNRPDHTIVVSFSVRWGQIGSITGWVGTCKGGQNDLIVGQWLLARPNSDFAWDHILAGQDRFTKQ